MNINIVVALHIKEAYLGGNIVVKRALTLFLIFLIVLYILLGPALFKKFWVDYKESYEHKKNEIKWKGVITFWDFPKNDAVSGSKFGWINRRIKEFEKKHPGVYIEFRALDSVSGKTALRAASKIGANPDIAPVGNDYYFISSDLLEPLDDLVLGEEKEDFLEEALSSCSYNGALYGLPWARKAYTLLLNTDIFRDREVDVPENGYWSYEEFLESLKKLTFDSDGRGGIDTYGLCGFIESGFYNVFGIIMCDGARIIDEDTGKYCFDSPKALSGLKKLCDLINTYKVFYPDIGDMNQNKALNSFLSGKAAVLLGDAWMVPYLRNIGSKYGINFATAHYPSGDIKTPSYMNDIYYSYGIFKQEDLGKKEACIEFVKYITGKEFQDELTSFGCFPVRKSGSHIYQNDKEMYTIQKGLNYTKNIPFHKNWWEIDGIIQYNILEAVNGNKTPEKALRDAKEQTEKFFQTSYD